MALDYRVISIGTLAAHPLWGEEREVRTGHATTTLISAGAAQVLVDPSLPGQALLARLGERTPIKAGQITHVFLTSADALHRRAIGLFESAQWLAAEQELEAARGVVAAHSRGVRGRDLDRDLAEFLRQEHAVLDRCRPAPDRIAPGVDLFPMPGVTPGACGLLLSMPRATVLVCGDAVATIEHLEQGKVLSGCFDVEQARESFAEALQIADLLILGRDNIALSPLRGGMAI
jgi:glyoxylase-like metal-dependent hydrolase (beta-lactamase superfamily II)